MRKSRGPRRSAVRDGRSMGDKETNIDSSSVPSSEEYDLAQLFKTVWRGKWLVGSTVVVATAFALVYVRQLVPQYEAETDIMIVTRVPEVVDFDTIVDKLPIDDSTMQNEIEMLRSRGLAQRVIDELHLDNNPEFNTSLVSEDPNPDRSSPSSPSDQPLISLDPLFALRDWLVSFKQWLVALMDGSDAGEEGALSEGLAKEERQEQRSAVIDAFLGRLDVSQKKESRVISIHFTSYNAKTAALVTNAIADLYILEQREAKFEATRRAAAWLLERVVLLREKVAESERSVEHFQQESGLDRDASLLAEQISGLNVQLTKAQADRAEAEGRLSQVKRLANSPKAAAEILSSPIIETLRRRQLEIELKADELTRRYSVEHPDMDDLRAEIADIQAEVNSEIGRIVKRLENDLSAARARVTSLKNSLNALKLRAAEVDTAEVELRALEREADANRKLLAAFLDRFKRTSSQEDIELHEANARIISRADVPNSPATSPKLLLVAVALCGSTFMGVVLVLLTESLKSGFRSPLQLEQATGLPVLALVPILSRFSRRGGAISYALRHPRSTFAESLRDLRTSLLFSQSEVPPKTILVTSTQPQEGKTTIAVCLARLQALAGKSVVVVDADLRRPGIQSAFGICEKPGLTELLAGEVLLKDVVCNDEESGADIIQVGLSTATSADSLVSDRMEQLITLLENRYDIVIFDSPPVMSVSDARTLCGQVDVTVFVLRWAKTKRETADLALKQIATAGGHIAGIVLTMIDTKTTSRYRYSLGRPHVFSLRARKNGFSRVTSPVKVSHGQIQRTTAQGERVHVLSDTLPTTEMTPDIARRMFSNSRSGSAQ